MAKKISQVQFILSYYKKNPNRDIPHKEVVDWINAEAEKVLGKRVYDPDRAIRSLCDRGLLIKRSKGVYCYDPKQAIEQKLIPFTDIQKKEIFKRDCYKCVVCGHGKKEGVEIHADHIRPRNRGGESTVKNGQTLCAQHNYQKKTLKQTEAGKKMFIRLYKKSRCGKNEKITNFSRAILELYKEHDINGHIEWDEKS